MNKATIDLSIKTVSEDERLIEGWATRAEEDRVGDVVLPRGVSYKLPLPFLLDHDHRKAVGEVDRVEVTDKGIKFWAHIKKIAEPGEVRDMCDAAWSLVKNGLRKSVSIGFRSIDAEHNSRGFTIKKWEWLELSAVCVPALASAAITSVKSVGESGLFVSVPIGAKRNGGVPLIQSKRDPEAKPEGGAVRLVR